jgi:anti-sigma-K factor RskA
MNCSELTDGYDLYALGVLEEPERSELRAHLARECAVCAPEVRRAALRVAALASMAPEVEPPNRLRGRIMTGIGVQPRFHWNWMQTWATLVAAVIVAMLWFGHHQRDRVRDIAVQESLAQLRQSESESARLKDVLALVNAPDTIVRVSSEGAAQPPQGKVFLNPKRGVLLLASNLPPAPAGKTYEMWVIPAGGKPVPAGLFQTEADGSGVHLFKGPVDVAGAGAVAVTLEAAEGAPQPTSTPIIVAPMKKG